MILIALKGIVCSLSHLHMSDITLKIFLLFMSLFKIFHHLRKFCAVSFEKKKTSIVFKSVEGGEKLSLTRYFKHFLGFLKWWRRMDKLSCWRKGKKIIGKERKAGWPYLFACNETIGKENSQLCLHFKVSPEHEK